MTYACRNYENRFFVSAIAALRIVLQQVQGAVFFEEWRDANFSETALFVACCLICIGSVTFISVRNEKTKPAGVKKSKSVPDTEIEYATLIGNSVNTKSTIETDSNHNNIEQEMSTHSDTQFISEGRSIE